VIFQWEEQHAELSCEDFQAWKEANDPELQAMGIARHLEENGIGRLRTCGRCSLVYNDFISSLHSRNDDYLFMYVHVLLVCMRELAACVRTCRRDLIWRGIDLFHS
jgi:hypothetical protein